MMKKIVIILLSAVIVSLGFIRDYLFININWIYKTLTEGRMNQARKEFQFLLEWQPEEIMQLKWILTVLFYIFFFGLTLLIIHLSFKNKIFNWITMGAFLAMFGISGVLFILGKTIGNFENFYGIVRTIMGFVQSFIPLMILWLVFKFFPDKSSR